MGQIFVGKSATDRLQTVLPPELHWRVDGKLFLSELRGKKGRSQRVEDYIFGEGGGS